MLEPKVMKVFLPAGASFVAFSAAVIVGHAYQAGSTFRDVHHYALMFGSLQMAFLFAVLVRASFMLCWGVKSLSRHCLPHRSILPWLMSLPLGLLMLSKALPDSPQTLFRYCVAAWRG